MTALPSIHIPATTSFYTSPRNISPLVDPRALPKISQYSVLLKFPPSIYSVVSRSFLLFPALSSIIHSASLQLCVHFLIFRCSLRKKHHNLLVADKNYSKNRLAHSPIVKNEKVQKVHSLDHDVKNEKNSNGFKFIVWWSVLTHVYLSMK